MFSEWEGDEDRLIYIAVVISLWGGPTKYDSEDQLTFVLRETGVLQE